MKGYKIATIHVSDGSCRIKLPDGTFKVNIVEAHPKAVVKPTRYCRADGCGNELPSSKPTFCSIECRRETQRLKELSYRTKEHKKLCEAIKKLYKPIKLPKTKVSLTELVALTELPISVQDRIGYNSSLHALGVLPETKLVKKRRSGTKHKYTYKCSARTMEQIEGVVRHYETMYVDTANTVYKEARDRYFKLWNMMRVFLEEK